MLLKSQLQKLILKKGNNVSMLILKKTDSVTGTIDSSVYFIPKKLPIHISNMIHIYIQKLMRSPRLIIKRLKMLRKLQV